MRTAALFAKMRQRLGGERLTEGVSRQAARRATLQRRVETLRPDGERSPGFIAKQEARIARVLAAINADLGALGAATAALRGDQITTAVALGYVDFRFNDQWHGQYPALASWYAEMMKRRSLALTVPTRTAPIPLSEMTRR